jgi:DHA3 family macrolide efflux protein-like MFS transporter
MKRYLIFFSGQASSLLGSELVQFALIWWLTSKGGSATTLATAALVGLLPPVLLGPFAGALVDRWDRRKVMMAADAAIALATLCLALLFASGTAKTGHVYGALFVRSLGGAFHWPAMQASIATLVPQRHLARAAGANQTLRGVAGIAMPPLGAALVVFLPIAGILMVDVATAFLAIVTLVFVPIPSLARGADAAKSISPWTDLKGGARYVAGQSGLPLLIVLIAFLHFLAAPAFALVPVAVTRKFGGGAAELAWMQSASGLGLVLGGLTLGLWGGFSRRIVTVLAGIAAIGVCLASFAALPQEAFPIAVTAILGSGLFASMAIGSFQAILQAVVPAELHGRVFALSRSGIDAMSPLGLAVAGPLADSLGLEGWYLATGAVMAVMAAAAFFVPKLMNLEKRSDK